MRALVSVVIASALVVGCSKAPATLDRSDTQAAVVAAVAKVVEPDVRSASCPGDLPRAQGHSFACTVALGAGIGTLRARVREVDGDGHLSVTLLDVPLRDEGVALQLKDLLKRRFERSFQVDCGHYGWRIRAVGDTFVCRARDASSRRSVEVTVADGTGRLTFDLVR